jgi:DNA recombination protein RmuC
LRQATDEHDKAMGRLSQGAGNVIGQVEKLKALGAMTTKSIGQEFDAEEEGVVDRAVQR